MCQHAVRRTDAVQVTEDVAVGQLNCCEEQRIEGWDSDEDNLRVLARQLEE